MLVDGIRNTVKQLKFPSRSWELKGTGCSKGFELGVVKN